MSERVVLGTIRPGENPGDPPIFTIVRGGWDAREAGVRPCEHHHFVLDPQWSTVTCKDCGDKVEPFAALLHYARWFDRFRARAEQAAHAEKRLTVARLRRLRGLRACAEADRAEIETAIREEHRRSPESLATLANRVERATNEARAARRVARRRKAATTSLPDNSPTTPTTGGGSAL